MSRHFEVRIDGVWRRVDDRWPALDDERISDEQVMDGAACTGMVRLSVYSDLAETWIMPRSFPCRLIHEPDE